MADGLEALHLIAERAGEPATNIERAPAHAGDCAHVLYARIGELADDK